MRLPLISIRLPSELIRDYKLLATLAGGKYQTIMRSVLEKHAEEQKSKILRFAAEQATRERNTTRDL